MTDEQYKLSVKLNADRPLHNKLMALKLQLEEYNVKVDVGAINYESDGSTPSKNGNSVERKINNYIDDTEELKVEIRKTMDELSASIRWKKALIDNLKDSRLYAIASMLFISYMTVEKTAEVMGYESRTIIRKKIQILDYLLNVIECHYD